MKVTKKKFGTLSDGSVCKLYTIDNGKMSVCMTDFGATLTGIFLPNSDNTKDDILLGYSTLDGFVNCPGLSFGSIVGRFANRIKDGKFSIDGTEYNLDKNEKGINTLHGGFTRYDHFVWSSKIISGKNEKGVEFTRISPSGEQGFPGNVKLSIKYTLNTNNELKLEYKATTDKKTPINLTNHAYFNLKGSGTVLDHSLQLNSEYILEIDDKLIPTGNFTPVKDTPFDFNIEKVLKTDIDKVGVGYDHCYTTCWFTKDSPYLEPTKESFLTDGAEVCVLKEKSKNRTMKVYTNLPGIQVYTGNHIEDVVGKLGRVYNSHDAICLETQNFPDAPNKSNFPDCMLEPDEEYNAITVYKFEF